MNVRTLDSDDLTQHNVKMGDVLILETRFGDFIIAEGASGILIQTDEKDTIAVRPISEQSIVVSRGVRR